MKLLEIHSAKFRPAQALLCLPAICGLLVCALPLRAGAQTPPPTVVVTDGNPAAPPPAAITSSNAPSAGATTNAPGSEGIQVSFQGANIDMIVQWLGEQTGKSVMKHSQVQCQLTISSSRKVTTRQAIDLIYRALALEGVSVTETENAIYLTRDGQEPKITPELLSSTRTNVPEGRQRMLKAFPLTRAQAVDLRERVKLVLTEKATVDVDDKGNQLFITDYNDNLRMVGELIQQLDVPTTSDFLIEIYPLKFAEAEEVAYLISMILNAQSPPPPAPRPSGPSRPTSSPMIMAGMPSDSGSSGSGGAASQAASQQVRIWPDKNANRLIVSAPRSKIPEIERLKTILDTTKPEDVSVRVIPLRNMSAMDLFRQIGPLYRAMSGRSPKEMIELTADEQSNSLIVLSSEVNYNNMVKLINTLDTEDAQEKTMRTFTLKNAEAADVAKQLQDLQEASSTSRGGYSYSIYYVSAPPSRNKKMTVVPDQRRNAVIVQAPPAQMEAIEKMVEELDAPIDDGGVEPKIFRLKYVSATDLEAVLNELFLKKTQSRSYYDLLAEDWGLSSPQQQRDVGRLYGRVRITAEPYSNTLIVTANSKENLETIENMIKQLDSSAEAGESTIRVGLRFASAGEMARSLNILFARNGSPAPGRTQQQQPQGGGGAGGFPNPQQQQNYGSGLNGFSLEREVQEEGYFPWLGGQPDQRGTDGRPINRPVSDLVDRVRVVPDQRGNALLVSANVHLMPQILKLIDELDAPSDQVLIEARIVEVSSDFMDRLGVRWSPDGDKVFTSDDFDNSLLVQATTRYRQEYGPSVAGEVAQALTALRSGVLDSTISMDFLIQFLRKTTEATVLGDPQITINDNEMGKLFVGQRVPTLTAQNNPALGGTTQNFEYQDVGVILEVTPHINNRGDVDLKIHAESSSVVPGQLVLGTVVIDTRSFRTELTCKDGQTLVLGGIIQRQISDTLRKTPILGSIPGLGWLFKKKDKITREVELMVFLRPKVVRSPEAAEELMREIDEKAPLVRKWRESNQPEQKEQKKDK